MNMIFLSVCQRKLFSSLVLGTERHWGGSFCKMGKQEIARSGNANEPPGTLDETLILIILCG